MSQRPKVSHKATHALPSSKPKADNSDWLFSDGHDAEPATIKVNESFAQRYATKKRDERIAVLEAEVEALDESINSAEEREDEMGELVTENVATEFLDVLNKIRRKDPKLYDPQTKFFENEGEVAPAVVKKTLVEEQEQLKRELQEAARARDDERDDDDDDDDKDALLVPVIKSATESARVEEEFKQFLAEKKAQKLAEGGADMGDFWAAPAEALNESDRFLRDYIISNGWVDEDGPVEVKEEELAALSQSEEELERVDDFERQWNFRHEEPGPVGPVSYPRDLPSVRAPKVTARKLARVRSAEQKRLEKERLAEELKRLKAEKRREIMSKMRTDEREMEDEEDAELRAKLASMSQAEMDRFLEDYLKMDFEDVVGGIKTRFTYDEVTPNSYGLRPEDLVELDDDTLQKFVPMEMIAPHKAREWKPSNKKLKWVEGKLKKSRAGDEGDVPSKKKKRKRKGVDAAGEQPAPGEHLSKRERKQRKRDAAAAAAAASADGASGGAVSGDAVAGEVAESVSKREHKSDRGATHEAPLVAPDGDKATKKRRRKKKNAEVNKP